MPGCCLPCNYCENGQDCVLKKHNETKAAVGQPANIVSQIRLCTSGPENVQLTAQSLASRPLVLIFAVPKVT